MLTNPIFAQYFRKNRKESFFIVVLPKAKDRKLLHQFLEIKYPKLYKTSLRCEIFKTKECRYYKECYCGQKRIPMKYHRGIEDNNIDERYSGICPNCDESICWECNYDGPTSEVIYVEHNNIVAIGDYFSNYTRSTNVDFLDNITDEIENKLVEMLKGNVYEIKNPKNSPNKKRLGEYISSWINKVEKINEEKIIVVFDLNDTLTLLNDVDPEKSTDVVLYQLVSQNIFVNEISLENYIKTNIPNKSEQRKTYGNLLLYVENLVSNNLTSNETIKKIKHMHGLYKNYWEECLKNGGFFDSFHKFLKYCIKYFPKIKIQIQSFGNEIPKIMDDIMDKYPDISTSYTILEFFDYSDDSGKIDNLSKELILRNMQETNCTISYCKTDYTAWVKEGFGKPLIYGEGIKTIFFDDNAYRCATIVEKSFKNNKQEYKIIALDKSSPYYKNIVNVETAKALTNPNYFIELFEKILE